MADDFSTDASGAVASKTFAADEIAGKLHTRVKVEFGDDGTAQDVSATHPLPVDAGIAKNEDAVHTSGDAGVMALAIRKDTAAGLASNDGDYHPLEVDASGRLWVNVGSMPGAARTTDTISAALATDKLMSSLTELTPKFAKIAVSSSGASTVVAAVTGKKIRVLSWSIVANAAVNAKWQSHTTPTDLTGLHYCAANGGISVPFSPVGHFETVAGEALDINLSGAVAVGGSLVYVEV